jgi:hypothetical protein
MLRLPYSLDCVEGEFCEVGLPLYGVLRSSREIGYSIDKGGPISSIPCELNALPSSSRAGLLPSFASSSKNRRDSDPSFTAVGQQIAYSGDSSGPYWGEIFTIPVNGGTPTQLTFSTHTADIDPDYRPDGQMIVYSHLERGSHNNPLDYEIQTTPATGGPGGQRLTSNSSNIDDLAPSTRPTGNRSPIRAPAASATAPTTRSSRCPLPEGRPSKSHSTTQTTAVLPGSPESGSIRFANSSSRPQEVGIGPQWRGEALGVPRPDERGG